MDNRRRRGRADRIRVAGRERYEAQLGRNKASSFSGVIEQVLDENIELRVGDRGAPTTGINNRAERTIALGSCVYRKLYPR